MLIELLDTLKTNPMPCHTNRASELGHPCDRYLVYCRKNWMDRLPMTRAKMDELKWRGVIEDVIKSQLEKAGGIVTESQRPYEWKEYEITGHIDFKFKHHNSSSFPVEVKTVNLSDFMKINDLDDMINAKNWWIRKYPAQLLLYMLMGNNECGTFFLKSIPGFKEKEIEVFLNDHLDYAEGILQKAERINKHIHDQTMPNPLEDDPKACKMCSFLHICNPVIVNTDGIDIEDTEGSEDIEALIDRCNELKPYCKEYDELSEQWREIANGRSLICGKYQVIAKKITVRPHEVKGSESYRYFVKGN